MSEENKKVIKQAVLLFLVGSSFVSAISMIIYSVLFEYRKNYIENLPGPIPAIFLILVIYGISAIAYHPIVFGTLADNWSIVIGFFMGMLLALLGQPLGLHKVFFGEYVSYYIFAPLACMLISRFYTLNLLKLAR